MLKNILFVMILSLACAGVSQSQTPEAPDLKKLRANAELLLEGCVAQVPQLQRLDNRIYAQSSLADLLWVKDEARARALLIEAMGSFAELAQQPGLTDERNPRLQQMTESVRGHLFNILVQRDPGLALQFLRQARELNAAKPGRNKWQEHEMEMNLAVRIAEQDPQAALKTAKEILASDEISWSLVNVFQALQQKDPAAASELFDAALDKLKKGDRSNGSTFQQYVSFMSNFLNVLKGNLPPLETPKPNPPSPKNEEAQKPREEQLQRQQAALRQFRDLLEWFIAEALKTNDSDSLGEETSGIKNMIVSTLHNFVADIEKLMPQRLAAVRAKLAQAENAQPNNFYRRYQKQVEKGTADELLALAQKAPKHEREYLVQNALNKAVNADGNEAQVRKLIEANLSDPEQRRNLLNQLAYQLASKAFNSGKLEEARAHLNSMNEPTQRFQLLSQWAQQKLSANDQKAGLIFINDAQALLGNRFFTSQQIWMQLELAKLYVEVEPSRALTICETAMARLAVVNQAQWTVNLYQQAEIDALENEMPLAELHGQFIPQQLPQALAQLVRKNLEAVQRLMAQWSAPELRLGLQLSVARELQEQVKNMSEATANATSNATTVRRPAQGLN